MKNERDRVHLEGREFRGSRYRCLLATHQAKGNVAAFLNSLVQPFARVGDDDKYMPGGFCNPDEARLGEVEGFLELEQRENASNWWLAVRSNANTPNWDIVSTCSVNHHKGLVLIEAKAHADELNPNDSCGAKNQENRQRISAAISDVSRKLGQDWNLSPNRRYQLSNRFAWAWKIAEMGVPVILVYLGFLNAREMLSPFASHNEWERCLREYAEGTVPDRVWREGPIVIGGTPMKPIIRSADVNLIATIG
jgi:hypothetical protein